MMAAYYSSNNVTTDHIQQYLDENKSLILKIVESQNSGRHAECAENQARLQRNLMYLAAIADSQPPPPTIHAQYASAGGGMVQQQQQQTGAHFLQPQQMAATQSLMAARSSMMYGQAPLSALQQQHAAALYGQQLGIGSSGIQMLQSEGGGGGFGDFDQRMGSGLKQEMHGGGSDGGRGGGGSSSGDTLYLKAGN